MTRCWIFMVMATMLAGGICCNGQTSDPAATPKSAKSPKAPVKVNGDWPNWRGPNDDGSTQATGLPSIDL